MWLYAVLHCSYIFWFNIMMTVLKMVTKIILQQGDIIRIGVVEAEWHRYLLANRCEYAFALYGKLGCPMPTCFQIISSQCAPFHHSYDWRAGSVFKFTLFTEIENWRCASSLCKDERHVLQPTINAWHAAAQ